MIERNNDKTIEKVVWSMERFEEAIEWLRGEMKHRAYGSVTLRVVLHDGCVAHFDRIVSDRLEHSIADSEDDFPEVSVGK